MQMLKRLGTIGTWRGMATGTALIRTPARTLHGRLVRMLAALLVGLLVGACGTDAAKDAKADAGGQSGDSAATSDTSVVDDATSADGIASDAGPGLDGQGDVAQGNVGDAVADASAVSIPCDSDKDCVDSDGVCDKAASVCVDCLTNADCAADQTCKAHKCKGPALKCASSKTCAPLGQLCDKTAGLCVDCVGPEDCDTGKVCSQTVCRPRLHA